MTVPDVWKGKRYNTMQLFDLHCDTPYRLLSRKQHLSENNLHISLGKVEKYENYGQVAAVCAEYKKDDATAFARFLEISDNFFRELDENSDRAVLCRNGADIKAAWNAGKAAYILSVEDARILEGDISRLDFLYERGVRVITLMWAGSTIIGGSHNTEDGLTEFGKRVVARCCELGIIPDVSHASAASVDDTAAIVAEYKRPFIASHSCAYSLYGHTRNLRDRHIDAVIAAGGLIGQSLCRSHLAPDGAGVEDVVKHIEYYLSRGAGNNLALGCDLDGTDLPDGIEDVRDLMKIVDPLLLDGVTEEQIEKIFWRNAYDFAVGNIGCGAKKD